MNQHKFDMIDTEEKAYWLGFLWGDGCCQFRVRKNGSEEWSLKLDLKESDLSHIEKFRDFMESTHPIAKYKTKGYKGTSIYRLRFNCSHLGSLLWSHYGLKPNRESFDLQLIPKELWRHFIRGLLDSDGTIVISNVNESRGYSYTRTNLSIGGSHANLVTIGEYFKELGLSSNLPIVRQRHKGRDGTYRTISYCGNNRCGSILDFLYKDSTVYLDRKYKKYLEVKSLNK